jgi:hypothetical protein
VGRASELLLTFSFADRRLVQGRAFPFEQQVGDPATGSRLRVQFEQVALNAPAEAALFDLPLPADPQTRIIEFGGAEPGRPGGVAP